MLMPLAYILEAALLDFSKMKNINEKSNGCSDDLH